MNKKFQKKFKKSEKNSYGFFSSKNWLEMAMKETKIQIIVSFRSYPMRNKKFQTNSKKIQKIIKKQLWLLFKQKLVGNDQERQKYKLSFRFVPTQCVIENSKQIAKKYKKL